MGAVAEALPLAAAPLLLVAPSEALGRAFVLPTQAPATLAPIGRGPAGEPRQGFRVGSLNLTIRYDQGSELAELPPLVRLPHAPTWFLGMANQHGVLVPVFDLAGFVGLDAAPPANPMLLVLGHGPAAAGVVIDGIPERLRLDAGDRLDESIVPAGLADCVARVCVVDGKPWFDLDVSALLARLEGALAA